MTTTSPAPVDGTPAGARGRVMALLLLVVIAVVATAGWWYVRPFSGGEEPVPGEVLTLDAVQVNLADGHFLRVGLALQLAEGAEPTEGSQALDATIELFSGRDMADLAAARTRHRLKDALLREIRTRYDDEVLALYFTEFVMQ